MTPENFAADIVERLDALHDDKNNAQTVLTNLISSFIEARNEAEQLISAGASISLDADSVRLGTVGNRVKCIVVVDVNALSSEDQQIFASRAMLALTRMGEKVITRKPKSVIGGRAKS